MPGTARPGSTCAPRLVRIMPGYLVAVIIILTLLPEAGPRQSHGVAGQPTLTQVYVPHPHRRPDPDVEPVGRGRFYLALPLLALLARRLPVRARVP